MGPSMVRVMVLVVAAAAVIGVVLYVFGTHRPRYRAENLRAGAGAGSAFGNDSAFGGDGGYGAGNEFGARGFGGDGGHGGGDEFGARGFGAGEVGVGADGTRAWQRYPVWWRIGFPVLMIAVALLGVYFLMAGPDSPYESARRIARQRVGGVVVIIGGVLGFLGAVQLATARVRIADGVCRFRSLFRNIDFTADDVAYTVFYTRMGRDAVSSGGPVTYVAFHLKNGPEISLPPKFFKLGEFNQVARAKLRPARPR